MEFLMKLVPSRRPQQSVRPAVCRSLFQSVSRAKSYGSVRSWSHEVTLHNISHFYCSRLSFLPNELLTECVMVKSLCQGQHLNPLFI